MKRNSDIEIEKEKRISLLDIAGLTAGFFGVVAAIFWLIGRVYHGGYFNARSSIGPTVTLSTNDLISFGFANGKDFFTYTSLAIFLLLLEVAIIKEIPNLIIKIEKRILPKWKKENRIRFLYGMILLTSVTSFFVIWIGYQKKSFTITGKVSSYDIIPNIIALIFLIFSLDLGIQQFYFTASPNKYSSNTFLHRALSPIRSFLIVTMFIALTLISVLQASQNGYMAGCLEKFNGSIVYSVFTDEILPLNDRTKVSNSKYIYKYSNYFIMRGDSYTLLYQDVDQYSGNIIDPFLIRNDTILGFKAEFVDIPESEIKSNLKICEDLISNNFQHP